MKVKKFPKFFKFIIFAFLILISIPIGLFFLVFLFLFLPVQADNFANKNLGKDMWGKYYVVTREEKQYQLGDISYWLNSNNEDYLHLNEVVLFHSSKYENYFESSKMNFEISLPCRKESNKYKLTVSGYKFKEKESYVHLALKEIDPNQVTEFCSNVQN